jgi:hypothetical protein
MAFNHGLHHILSQSPVGHDLPGIASHYFKAYSSRLGTLPIDLHCWLPGLAMPSRLLMIVAASEGSRYREQGAIRVGSTHHIS